MSKAEDYPVLVSRGFLEEPRIVSLHHEAFMSEWPTRYIFRRHALQGDRRATCMFGSDKRCCGVKDS